MIAQSLAAAFYTVPDPAATNGSLFLPHSMHCYFLLAGDAAIPIIYHVERVRNGRSFVTRTVQARQRGRCIFTTTISFVAERSPEEPCLEHGWDLPSDAIARLRSILHDEEKDQARGEDMTDAKSQEKSNQDSVNVWPFTAKPLGIENSVYSLGKASISNSCVDVFQTAQSIPRSVDPNLGFSAREPSRAIFKTTSVHLPT